MLRWKELKYLIIGLSISCSMQALVTVGVQQEQYKPSTKTFKLI